MFSPGQSSSGQLFLGQFPNVRHRRLRQSEWIRDLVQETTITLKDLILPIFVREPETTADLPWLPGSQSYTIEELDGLISQVYKAGILAIMLFPITPQSIKTADGSEAINENNLICRAIKHIKYINKNIGVIADVALDPYTTHGHDGIVCNGDVDNDLTVEILCKQALNQVNAGADAIAPSDMMDGRVKAIRHFLDTNNFPHSLIISYAVKYASSFYGPFRKAMGIAKLNGPMDKKTYQLNPANADEALREVALDLQEGADMIIIKPGMPYLDIIHRVSHTFKAPTIAYQVSGECAALIAAEQNGWLDGKAAMLESLIAFKRAGACAIISYLALRMAPYLK